MAYPAEIFERSVNVVDGLPSKHKWAPRIAEIKEELERLMLPIRREEDRQEAQRQHRLTRDAPVERGCRPNYEALQARCARDGLFFGPKAKKMPPLAIKEFRDNFNISDKQWNAIPDAKHV